MRHLQRTRIPPATSGRFRRANLPETPRSAGVSPGRQNRRRTTPAGNRPEVHDPWRNRCSFPAKPSRTRGGRDHGRSLGSRKRRCGARIRHRRVLPAGKATATASADSEWGSRRYLDASLLKEYPYRRVRLRISMTNTPTTAIRLLGHCYQAFNQGRKKGRSHVKNGQHVASASSAMLQPNPSNEVLIICRMILFPSCLRTISSSPGVLERCMQLL